MTALSLRNIVKTYGTTPVIHSLSLDVNAGEFLVILGPSGCGKSTLLRMVAGLEAISAGDITIDDVRINALEPRERGCAMVFQNYALYPHMTVAENIGYALKVSGMARSDRMERIRNVAAMLDLELYLDRKPAQLSGGQKQRVAMGRAMIREPKLFLYDEPLSNLDAKLRVAMRAEIRRLHQKLGTTSLFVTHDQIEAMTLADRIVVMNAGRIEQIGTPDDVYHRPQTVFVADFIGSPGMNIVEGLWDADRNSLKSVDGHALVRDGSIKLQHPSGPLRVGFRAEKAKISAGPEALNLDLDYSEELGATRLLIGNLGRQKIVVSESGTVLRHDQRRVSFQIDPESLSLFDAVTGRSLDVIVRR